jgi:hypothetical protein
MIITLKPLTAHVSREGNIATLEIKNEQGDTVLKKYYKELHTKLNPAECVSDNLAQMKTMGLNLVALETTMPGVELR